jgi:hypothetical protein
VATQDYTTRHCSDHSDILRCRADNCTLPVMVRPAFYGVDYTRSSWTDSRRTLWSGLYSVHVILFTHVAYVKRRFLRPVVGTQTFSKAWCAAHNPRVSVGKRKLDFDELWGDLPVPTCFRGERLP